VFAKALFSQPGHRLTDEEAEELLASPRGAYLDRLFTYSAVGTADVVHERVDAFREAVAPDEIMTVHHADCTESRLRSLEILADVLDLMATPVG
jgi:alkanesulfonate monooxygenase SsuD/methylene tetrahydromethanopterin reductase-like flavin-dependent oxidoreductase (luciferase family)